MPHVCLTEKLKLKTNNTTKEVYGVVNNKKVLILWDTKNENPKWKVDAINKAKS